VDAGWSRGLQAAVRGVFDCERAGLRSELQAFLSSHPEIDSTHLLSQLETLLQRQVCVCVSVFGAVSTKEVLYTV
jgi:hypothetical protein